MSAQPARDQAPPPAACIVVGEDLSVDPFHDSDVDLAGPASPSSRVADCRYEHGRRYHAVDDGGYALPNDEAEVDRLNLQHRVWDIALGGSHHLAPLDLASVRHVLDIGCGTGAWCIELANAHPHLHVTGTELSSIQPNSVPSNCEFLVGDANADWAYETRFDYVHKRAVLLGIKGWDRLIQQAFRSLHPGGWVEFQEFHIPIGCDDGSAGPDSAVTKWSRSVHEALKNLGIDSTATSSFRRLLGKHGFDSVGETHSKIPVGPWAKGRKEKAMGTLFQRDIGGNLMGISAKILTNGLGWPEQDIEKLVLEARDDFYNPQIHSYFPVDIFWAHRPAY